jgi:hypothetical protein
MMVLLAIPCCSGEPPMVFGRSPVPAPLRGSPSGAASGPGRREIKSVGSSSSRGLVEALSIRVRRCREESPQSLSTLASERSTSQWARQQRRQLGGNPGEGGEPRPGNTKGTNLGAPCRAGRTRRIALVLRTPPPVLNSTAANGGPPFGTKRPQVQILSPRPVFPQARGPTPSGVGPSL